MAALLEALEVSDTYLCCFIFFCINFIKSIQKKIKQQKLVTFLILLGKYIILRSMNIYYIDKFAADILHKYFDHISNMFVILKVTHWIDVFEIDFKLKVQQNEV